MSETVIDGGLIIKAGLTDEELREHNRIVQLEHHQRDRRPNDNYIPLRVAIVVPTYNNFEGLAAALASVRSKDIWTPYIIPNWRNNIGVAAAWNEGTKRAIADGADFILIINDDILFAPSTVDALVEHLLEFPNAVMATGCNKHGEMPDPFAILDYPKVEEQSISEHPDFSCFMIRPSTIDEIGWFDEGFKPAYFEDNDYHYRIKLSGKTAEATTRAPFYHYGSLTQNSQAGGVVPGDKFEANRNFYAKKWGGIPGGEQWTMPYGDVTKTWKDVS
jgi:glycosyltransferase involved in cell wall biosynthesis